MDLNDLWATLQATLLNDNDARKAAEQRLHALASAPGYLTALMQLCCMGDEVPLSAKLSGATALRRAILKMWHNDDPSAAPAFQAEEKDAVRAQLLGALAAQTAVPMTNAFCDICKSVFRHDYPDRWQTLPAQLLGHLQSGEPRRVTSACLALRQFTKVYDQSMSGGHLLLNRLLDEVMPTVTSIAQFLAQHAGDASGGGTAGADTLRHILKSVYSLTQFHLGEHPCVSRPDALVQWCGLATALLGRRMPDAALGEAADPGTPVAPEARARWGLWAVKKWCMKLLHRLADAHGQPALEDAGSPLHALATTLNKLVCPEVLRTVLALLAGWRREGRWLPDKVAFYALHFVQTCADFASCWKELQPACPFLLQEVVMPLQRMTAAEAGDFESDPSEYLRQSTEPWMDLSPRCAGSLLVIAMLKVRRPTFAPLVDAVIATGLETYAAAVAADDAAAAVAAGSGVAPPALAADPLLKEAVLAFVQLNRNFLCSSRKRRRYVPEGLLAAHVTPELASPHAVLRARAASVWAAFVVCVDFSEAPPAVVADAVRGLLAQLDDRSLAVRVTAGGVLCVFLKHSEAARVIIKPHVPLLLERLFGMLAEVGVDEVVQTVNEIIVQYSEHIAELAPRIVAQLQALFAELIADRDEDGAVQDESSMAAAGALDAISSVINALLEEQRMDALLPLTVELWPLLHFLLGDGALQTEFLDMALDLYAEVMVSVGRGVGNGSPGVATTDAAWVAWGRMMQTYRDRALDYTKNLLYPADVITSYAPERMALACDPATGLDNAGLVVAVAQFVEANSDERERGLYTCMPLNLLHYCHGRVDRLVAPIAALYARAACTGHTKTLRSQAAGVLGACLLYSVPLTLAALESQGAGASAAVLAAVYDSIHGGYFINSSTVKLLLLGLLSLLQTPLAAQPPALVSITPNTLAAVAALALRYEELLPLEAARRAEIAAAEDDSEGDGSNDDEDELAFLGAAAARNRAAADAAEGEGEGGDAAAAAAPRLARADDDAGSDGGDADEEAGEREADYVHEEDLKHRSAWRERDAAAESKARARAAAGLPAELPAGDEDFYEPPGEETPLDHLSYRIRAADALAFLASQPEAAPVQAATHPDVQRALVALVQAGNAERAAGGSAGVAGPYVAPPGTTALATTAAQ